jgi:hypothetical protein
VSRLCIFTWSHSRHTPQSVGLLWTGDRPVAETSDNTNTVQETNIHAPGGIRTHDPSKRSAADLRLRPRGHWDRLSDKFQTQNMWNYSTIRVFWDVYTVHIANYSAVDTPCTHPRTLDSSSTALQITQILDTGSYSFYKTLKGNLALRASVNLSG